MDDNEISLMGTTVVLRCFKKDTNVANSDQQICCKMILQQNENELIFTIPPNNGERVVCLQKISLRDVVSFTLRTGREGTEWMQIYNQKGNRVDKCNESTPVFPSVILLEMVNGDVVEIAGMPIAEVTSLLQIVDAQLQQQKREKNIKEEEKSSLSRLDQYIASKYRGNTLSHESLLTSPSPALSPSVMMPQSINNGEMKKGVLKPRRVNKYTALLSEKDTIHPTNGLSPDRRIEQLQGNVIMHLTPIGVPTQMVESFNIGRQGDDRTRRELSEGEQVNISLLQLDTFNSNMTSSLDNQRKPSLLPCSDGKLSGNVNSASDAAIPYASVLKTTDGMSSGRREAYLLKKLKEKTRELEKVRTELRFTEEVLRHKTEEGLRQEQMLLEKYKYLTPAQRALLDFDALLEPVLSLEEVQRRQEEEEHQRHSTGRKLQHFQQLSKAFKEQLQERSLSRVNTITPEVSLTEPFKEETTSPHATKQMDSQKMSADDTSMNNNQTSTDAITHSRDIVKSASPKLSVTSPNFTDIHRNTIGKSTLPPSRLELSGNDLPLSPPSPPVVMPTVTTTTTAALTPKPLVNTSSDAIGNLPSPPAGLPP
ncbi:uncharacterized protein TM35_000053550, partial [Trypanosoma theileri]